MRILILGGTGDSAALAQRLALLPQFTAITSLAGRTQAPAPITGLQRAGGFGGTTGLADYLQTEDIQAVVDATHPFATQMSWQAAAATAQVGIPLVMLVRPAWTPQPGDRWIPVPTVAAAAQSLPPQATRVFLTIGRQHLAPFMTLPHTWFLIRSIDPPIPDHLPPRCQVLLDRGPFDLDQERHLLQTYEIGAIVSKNSGGPATYAKIQAARELAIPIVMVQRPAIPPVPQVTDVEQVVDWLHTLRFEGGFAKPKGSGMGAKLRAYFAMV
jgi:precorrin-6A/cobalt-precorrin-6A reductase